MLAGSVMLPSRLSWAASRSVHRAMPMPRESTASGNVKIQQRHSRLGQPYCSIPIPAAVMELLEWQPGMYVTYYPTKAGELVIVRQDAVLHHVFPDYDFRAAAVPREWLGPKRGSVQQAAVEVEEQYDVLADLLTGKLKGKDKAAALEKIERDQARVESRVSARMKAKVGKAWPTAELEQEIQQRNRERKRGRPARRPPGPRSKR